MQHKLFSLLFVLGITGIAVATPSTQTEINTLGKATLSYKDCYTPNFASSTEYKQLADINLNDAKQLNVANLDLLWQYRKEEISYDKMNDFLIKLPKLTDIAIKDKFDIDWRIARAVYYVGNYGIGMTKYVTTDTGAKLFKYGADVANIAKVLEPKRIEGYYWYGIDLGSFGLANGIFSSLYYSHDLRDAMEMAYKIDKTYYWYGPSRILGLYYQDLPGLFGGSNVKAEKYLTEAVVNSPEYDNNMLFLGRFYLSLNKKISAKKAEDLFMQAKEIQMTKPVDQCLEENRFYKESLEGLAAAKAQQ